MKNRKAAIFICVIVMALSVFHGARRSLADKVQEVEDMFVYGVDGTGDSIYYDLVARAKLAHNLCAVAERYLDEDYPLIAAVRKTAEALEKEQSPARCYELNEKLDLAMAELGNALRNEPLSAADEKYRADIFTDYVSYAAMIAHDGYNDAVRELNEGTLKKFPTRYLKLLTMTDGAEYYG